MTLPISARSGLLSCRSRRSKTSFSYQQSAGQSQKAKAYEGPELESRLSALKAGIFGTLSSSEAIDAVVTRYCRRQLDRRLKKIDLSTASTVADITAEYLRQTAALNIADIAQKATARIREALADDDLPKLLANYDNKGLVALAASHLKGSRRADFESWLAKVLRNDKAPELVTAIRNSLPAILPQ